MKEWLLSCLCDYETGEPFERIDGKSEGEEIISGTLHTVSGKVCRINDGIPVFVASAELDDEQRDTVESFSWKWEYAKNYRKDTKAHYIQWYLNRYGFGAKDALARFLQGKKMILDAGTAHGRDAEATPWWCAPILRRLPP